MTEPQEFIPSLPPSLALIDDDREYSEFLAQYLRGLGMDVAVFMDGSELLSDRRLSGFDFYLVDLMLPGIDGAELIRVLRRRTQAGILVVSGKLAPDVFQQVVSAGADMYLTKPVQFEQVAVAIGAVHRRVESATPSAQSVWQFDRRGHELIAPDGARVSLSDADVVVLDCLADAAGEPVTRLALRERLGPRPEIDDGLGDAGDGLNAVIYRLRRRIERATPLLVPLQSKSRVGYLFRAPLKRL